MKCVSPLTAARETWYKKPMRAIDGDTKTPLGMETPYNNLGGNP